MEMNLFGLLPSALILAGVLIFIRDFLSNCPERGVILENLNAEKFMGDFCKGASKIRAIIINNDIGKEIGGALRIIAEEGVEINIIYNPIEAIGGGNPLNLKELARDGIIFLQIVSTHQEIKNTFWISDKQAVLIELSSFENYSLGKAGKMVFFKRNPFEAKAFKGIFEKISRKANPYPA